MKRKKCRHKWLRLDNWGAYYWCSICGTARVRRYDDDVGFRYHTPKTMIESLDEWEASKNKYGSKARRKRNRDMETI